MAFHTIIWHQYHFAQFGIHRHEVTSHLQNSFTQIYKNFFKNKTQYQKLFNNKKQYTDIINHLLHSFIVILLHNSYKLDN